MEGIRVEFENIDESKKRFYEICKRGIDIIGAGSGLLLLSPVIVVVACAVKYSTDIYINVDIFLFKGVSIDSKKLCSLNYIISNSYRKN
ncbi:hypothetical protein [Clostridium saudiense]|uniref:hypothetical protein n=1 Tax=Clostridium saudiense TaxID=1414720 RepID=UPI0018A94A0A|nr:hypothetical protein [Clostridium saudiense]